MEPVTPKTSASMKTHAVHMRNRSNETNNEVDRTETKAKTMDNTITKHKSTIIMKKKDTGRVDEATGGALESNKIQQQNYMCNFCEKTFSQKGGLDAHMRIHKGERPYNCGKCDKSFKQLSALNYHKTTHWKEGNKAFFCDECGKGYSSKQARDVHYKKHSSTKHYPCTQCDRRYNDPNSLRRHMKYHSGPDVPCSEASCKRMFTSRSEMLAHHHVHTGFKPFSCKMCAKAFTTKAKMQEHELLHQGMRPFECPVCQRAFSQKSNMLNHLGRIHKVNTDLAHFGKLENGKFHCTLSEDINVVKDELRGKYLQNRKKTVDKITNEKGSQQYQDLNESDSLDKHSNQTDDIDFSTAEVMPVSSDIFIEAVKVYHDQNMIGTTGTGTVIYGKEEELSPEDEGFSTVVLVDGEVAEHVEVNS